MPHRHLGHGEVASGVASDTLVKKQALMWTRSGRMMQPCTDAGPELGHPQRPRPITASHRIKKEGGLKGHGHG